jgi:hypothetical protein
MIALFLSNSRRPFRFLGFVPLAFVTSLAQTSIAQEVSAENRAAAEVLFRDAKALADKEQYEQACPKFQESHRIDPKPGTILNLAVCHEKQGKVASAWLDYLEAASFAARAGQKDREAFAKEQAAKLDKTVPRLIVRVRETTPGIVVKLDAAVVSEGVWGSATPVNPGKHTIEATALGYKAWENTFKIDNTPGNVEVFVPKLELESAGPPVDKPKDPPTGNGSKVVVPPDPPVNTIPRDKPTASRFNAPLWIGVGLGAIGLAGMIFGTVNGVETLSLRDAGNVECGPSPDETFCTQKGLDLHAQAAAKASYSTAGFIVGGVGLGAGAALIILGLRQTKTQSQAPKQAWILPHVDGMGLAGGISF